MERTGRLQHLQEIAVIPLWRLGVYLVFEAVGTALTWRDLLISKANQSKWRIDVLPQWDWGWWALGTAAVLLATLFEHSYRVRHRTEGERDAALAQADELRVREVVALERQADELATANRNANAPDAGQLNLAERLMKARERVKAASLRVVFEHGPPYMLSRSPLLIQTRKEMRVGILNSGPYPISNCDTYIENVDPEPNSYPGGAVRLSESSFDLNPGAPEHIVQVIKGMPPSFACPFETNSDFGGLIYLGSDTEFTVTAVAAEAKTSRRFRLSFDDHGGYGVEAIDGR